jgi:hypothetical protein
MEKDRRAATRIFFNSAIRYTQKGSAEYSNTVGKDLSNSGIDFISNEFIPKNSQLTFEIHSPWQVEPIYVSAEVVRVSSQPYSERFEIGAKFLTPIMPYRYYPKNS